MTTQKTAKRDFFGLLRASKALAKGTLLAFTLTTATAGCGPGATAPSDDTELLDDSELTEISGKDDVRGEQGIIKVSDDEGTRTVRLKYGAPIGGSTQTVLTGTSTARGRSEALPPIVIAEEDLNAWKLRPDGSFANRDGSIMKLGPQSRRGNLLTVSFSLTRPGGYRARGNAVIQDPTTVSFLLAPADPSSPGAKGQRDWAIPCLVPPITLACLGLAAIAGVVIIVGGVVYSNHAEAEKAIEACNKSVSECKTTCQATNLALAQQCIQAGGDPTPVGECQDNFDGSATLSGTGSGSHAGAGGASGGSSTGSGYGDVKNGGKCSCNARAPGCRRTGMPTAPTGTGTTPTPTSGGVGGSSGAGGAAPGAGGAGGSLGCATPRHFSCEGSAPQLCCGDECPTGRPGCEVWG